MGTTKKFETINHTSDVGIIAYGKTPGKIFENAAFGMFSLITDIEKVSEKILISVSIDAHDNEELLITFLNELLYYYSTKKVLFKRFDILKINETHLDANISGEQISTHVISNDIKAATYHNMKIEKITDGYKTQIIFDV
ncbi:MAG: archease [Elusimicrobia bacterium]|nr:archease [Elusimicrobiota bacterium]